MKIICLLTSGKVISNSNITCVMEIISFLCSVFSTFVFHDQLFFQGKIKWCYISKISKEVCMNVLGLESVAHFT